MTSKTPHAPTLVMGTAGHIDHGKSTLVLALTGIDPDRLEEEKRRGITIELGFSHLALPSGTMLGIVDVPGHEKFVRQMIAGASGIDLALLCIAADDGVMPQTREHLHVLELLGVKRAVVALTKCDLVDADWRVFIENEVAEFLSSTPYAESPIVAVSAKTGEGLDALVREIDRVAQSLDLSERQFSDIARLPIDRSFTVKGSGTVVTGTLWSGTVHLHDELEVLPSGTHVRVRGIQHYGVDAHEARPGSRTALNLAATTSADVQPGMMLATPDTVNPSDRFDAWFTYVGAQTRTAPLKTGVTVRISHGTKEVTGRLLLMDGKENIRAGESGFAQIRLERPLPVMRTDRFIVRSVSPVEVIGGGVVLLSHPRRRTTLKPYETALLTALKGQDVQKALSEALDAYESVIDASDLSSRCDIGISTCLRYLDGLCEQGLLKGLPSSKGTARYFARPQKLVSLQNSLLSALQKFHTLNPAATGMGKAELLRGIKTKLDPDSFDAVLALLKNEGLIAVEGNVVCHPEAGAQAKEKELALAKGMRGVLDEAGFTPPAISDLAEQFDLAEQQVHKVLAILSDSGEARRVDDRYYSQKALTDAEKIVVHYLSEHGPSTAAALKDALGVSRKYAIPLLEYLDSKGVTVRDGDMRKPR